jgi:hypothetical protein
MAALYYIARLVGAMGGKSINLCKFMEVSAIFAVTVALRLWERGGGS